MLRLILILLSLGLMILGIVLWQKPGNRDAKIEQVKSQFRLKSIATPKARALDANEKEAFKKEEWSKLRIDRDKFKGKELDITDLEKRNALGTDSKKKKLSIGVEPTEEFMDSLEKQGYDIKKSVKEGELESPPVSPKVKINF